MITQQQQAALRRAYEQACASGVLFPNAQACEMMVESAWGTSRLFLDYNNGFGMKQHSHPVYATVSLPTREFLDGHWTVVQADFINYPSLSACFADRMDTLKRLAPSYPHYAAALVAGTPEEFLRQVSMTWSTDPARSATCTSILHAHAALLQA
jgi:flagellum-specific peptidoglycan hydrolase FlgJ